MSSLLYRQFKSDESLEKSGVLIEYGVTESGATVAFRVARAGGANVAFTKRLEAKLKPYRRQIQTETIDNKVAEKVLREVYAETVVLGWENVEGPDGQPLPFTVQNCIKLFEDLPDLFKDLQEQSQRAALFRAANLEGDSGN